DANPGKHDLSALRFMLVGGSAVPESLIRAFQNRHGLRVVQAWGMTETSPYGSITSPRPGMDRASDDERYAYAATQGVPSAFVEVRARGDNGLVPCDGRSMGELEVRGPWVVGAYYNAEDAADKFTDDGWFRTGDVVTLAPDGAITI